MQNRRNEIIGILLIVVSLFVLLSMITFDPAEEPAISKHIAINNLMGIFGVYVSHWLIKMTIGYAAYIFPLLGLIWGWWIFSKRPEKAMVKLTIYVLALALLTAVLIGLPAAIKDSYEAISYHYSGLLGGLLANLIHDFLGTIGSWIFLIGLALILIRGYFSWSLYWPFKKTGEKITRYKDRRKMLASEKKREDARKRHTKKLLEQLKVKQPKGEKAPEQLTIESVEPSRQPTPEPKPVSDEKKVEPSRGESIAQMDNEKEFTIGEEVIEDEVDLDTTTKRPTRQYQLPSVDLLNMPIEVKSSTSYDELVAKANYLVQSLQTFGVEGKVVNISPGPVITLFEVEPAEGVRVSKFVQLSDDLARVMEAQKVRVVAPIPGKSTVGIEIPNRYPSIVYLRSVINSGKYVNSTSKLAVALGKTTSGENYMIEIDEMPHLLIAGTTGSGKSVCINTIITSILYRATPDEVRFILIDPKKLEMSVYRSLDKYHLLTTEDINEYVITTPENVVFALRAAEQEMVRRYDVLAEATVRNIKEFQEKAKTDTNLEKMPYILVIIDELADLMIHSPKDVEAPIARLAQMARAVGIHLVLATQRPSVDVITGIIKANFPARIAFQVATRVDSRTIVDSNGAEKLIGKGDMLFLPPGTSELIRLHNSYVTLEEINNVVDHITKQPTPEELKLEGMKVHISGEEIGREGDRDELFNEAVRLVVTHQQGSISLIQRRLRIGYSRAARLIDQMEQAGIVGPFTGSKAREVLVDDNYLSSLDDNGW